MICRLTTPAGYISSRAQAGVQDKPGHMTIIAIHMRVPYYMFDIFAVNAKFMLAICLRFVYIYTVCNKLLH